MDVRELRVGNFVELKSFEKTLEYGKKKTIINREIVSILGYDGVNKRVLIKPRSKRKNETWVSIGLIKPIQLTEGWLHKFGFEKQVNFYYISNLTSIYMVRPWVEASHLLVKTIGGEVISKIEYVHQLQNLFHALTNKELTITRQ